MEQLKKIIETCTNEQIIQIIELCTLVQEERAVYIEENDPLNFVLLSDYFNQELSCFGETLSVRAINVLRSNRIITAKDLKKTLKTIKGIRHCGTRTVLEICDLARLVGIEVYEKVAPDWWYKKNKLNKTNY